MSDHADLPGSTLQEAVPSQQHDPLQTSEHGSSFILSSCATAFDHALDVHDAYADLVLQGVSPWQQRDQYANAFEILAAADTTPGNVNSRIKPHFPRRALTRAKARALRDGLNLAYVCAEELD